MAKRKRESKVLTASEKRLAGLTSIDPNLDLGSGISIKSIGSGIDDLSGALAKYNQSLSDADGALNLVVAYEKKLRDLNERVLAGVAAKYGKDSTEYEKAGGKRKSERKRRAKKAKRGAAPAPKA